jgi:hypothetical protein
MHDYAGNSAKMACFSQQLIVRRKKPAVHEIMAFDAGECDGICFLAELGDPRWIGQERQGAAFPLAPGARAANFLGLIGPCQPTVIGLHEIGSLLCRYGRDIVLP